MKTNCEAFVYNNQRNRWRKCKLVGTSVKGSKYKHLCHVHKSLTNCNRCEAYLQHEPKFPYKDLSNPKSLLWIRRLSKIQIDFNMRK